MIKKAMEIQQVEAVVEEPKRADFETNEEFVAAHREWREAQEGPQVESEPEDEKEGPGATGWVDPDTVTGPGVQ